MSDCAILSIGRELLLGFTVDTNSSFLALEISGMGYRITECRVCDDELPQIVSAIVQLSRENDVLIITGGLGPTPDDLTREAIAEACGTELVFSDVLMEQIEERFSRMNRVPSESNRCQAFMPESGGFIENTCGTAPGVTATCGNCSIYAMPGVPVEMKTMFELSLKPLLEKSANSQCRYMKILRLCGIGESQIGEVISEAIQQQWDCEIGTAVDFGVINLRVMAYADNADLAQKKCEPALDFFREQLGSYIFGEDVDTIAGAIVSHLRQTGMTISLAESCSGGMISSEIVSIPGASKVFLDGVVTYSNGSKMNRLGVDGAILDSHGAVSMETALAMARGVRETSGSDFSLSVTGIAGPTGGTPEKPVGTVWIAAASETDSAALLYHLPYQRDAFRKCVTMFALDFLRRMICKLEFPKGTVR